MKISHPISYLTFKFPIEWCALSLRITQRRKYCILTPAPVPYTCAARRLQSFAIKNLKKKKRNQNQIEFHIVFNLQNAAHLYVSRVFCALFVALMPSQFECRRKHLFSVTRAEPTIKLNDFWWHRRKWNPFQHVVSCFMCRALDALIESQTWLCYQSDTHSSVHLSSQNISNFVLKICLKFKLL